MSTLGFKARVGSLIHTWWRCMCYMFPEIHLWCDTCWPIGSQHGSQPVLLNIPASRHWWTWNQDLLCHHSQCETRQAADRQAGRHSTNWAMLAWQNLLLICISPQITKLPLQSKKCNTSVVCYCCFRILLCLTWWSPWYQTLSQQYFTMSWSLSMTWEQSM